MNEILLLKGNPSKRRGKRRRSAAQRAATRKMLAANRSRFHSNPRKRRKSIKRRAKSAVASVRRSVRRARRSVSSGRSIGNGFVGLLKNGALMGAGAVTADVGMGLIAKFAPSATMLTSRINTDGTINYGYYATKGLLIYGMSKYGTRVTRHANTMAAGALAVMGYELIRSFMPADIVPLGYFNPGRIVNGGNLGRIMRNPSGAPQNVGRIMSLPAGAGKGAVASATIRNMNTAVAARRLVTARDSELKTVSNLLTIFSRKGNKT